MGFNDFGKRKLGNF